MAVARTQLEEAWAPQTELRQALRDLHAVTSRLPGGDGEDLAQEALTRAVANGVSPTTVPWLITVAKRVAIDRYRRSREVASGDGSDLERIAPAILSSPEDAVMTADGVRAVRQALATLPPRYREALLAFVEEGSASGVAKTMGMTPHATWTLLSRARERLRKELHKVGYIPAAIVARFGKLIPALVAGGIAVTVAIGVSLPSSKPAAGESRSTPVKVKTSSATLEGAVTKPSGATDIAPAVQGLPAPVPIRPTVALVSKHACTPSEAGTEGVPFGAGALIEQQDGNSMSSAVAAAVPSALRASGPQAGGCAQ